ncbi:reverse transcriptase [Gossypium australe]|uniref:Reverse transcriptase n=1 Tax=Gossypium australe TaxID=47621 RepID=A0A5B6VBQ2_9ROSI|nr:reverse transcriptase [Gossypium australe]
MQCNATGERMINSECLPFGSNMDHEQINFMGNNFRPQNNPYSNNYNLGWRNHPNFFLRWSRKSKQEKKPNLEEMLTKFISVSKTRFQDTEIAFKNPQALIQGLEN